MKNRIIIQRKFVFTALMMFALAIGASAQPENFRVGETVETNDGRVCKILSITGKSAKVACGTNRSDIRVYSFGSMTSQAAAQAKREQQEQQRQNAANQPRVTTVTFNKGDTVQMPNGKVGVIESLTGDVAKVKIGNEFDFIAVQDLKKIETEPPRTFRVGEQVVSGSGQAGVIETLSDDGRGAKVRYGNGKYDFKWEAFANLRTPGEGRRDAEQEKMWKVFRVEARPYLITVQKLEQFYNPKAMDMKGSGLDDEGRKKASVELAELDRICRTKYPNIENDKPINPRAEVLINERYGDQCAIAREREPLLKKAKARFLALDAERETHSWSLDINPLSGENGYEVSDKLQTLIYDRAAWEKKNIEYIRKKYAAAGETMPADAFAALYKIADELKAKIEADAPTRSWEQSKFKDAALEGVVKRRIAADYPGGQVLKIGLDSANWSLRDGKENIGSNSSGTQYYLRIKGAYRIRTGRALVRLPNQSFCQIRYIELIQSKKGAGFEAAWAMVETRGKFVKC